MTATEDRELRRAMHGLLEDVSPKPAPLEQIVRRGASIRLRRAGAAVGGLALAGLVAVTTLALAGGRHPPSPATVPQGPVVPGGVIAQGVADGHPWRLAIQDIADPGYPCLPGITINGTDADWVYPDPGNEGAVALGRALPGFGFAFIQLPAGINGVTVDGRYVPAVTVAACGARYHIAGFAYSLAEPLRVTVTNPPPGWPAVITMPLVSTQPPSPATTPENPGLWIVTTSVQGREASGILASGYLSGQEWLIWLTMGAGGDCYAFNGAGNQMGSCGPMSTPAGPETIVALPLGFPSPGSGATGYAVQVSPGTVHLKAVLSDGSVELVTPRVVDGRKYAAFIVPNPLRLSRLIWLDARGRVITSTTVLPPYGYVQFQP
ncbi:MAG TPA: hypothetical protein VED20_14395 [Streptosporangiaceae bacterium]|nr:hypothetical protein [Streptosporangiaceae bacterium]